MLVDIGRIAGRAAIIRHKCGFFDGDPPYSTNLITERCFPGLVVIAAKLPSLKMLEMVHVEGKNRVLYYNEDVPDPDRRVGITHGLGHLLDDLKRRNGIRECHLGRREAIRDGLVTGEPVELRCDLFTGELLVPFEVLDRYAPAVLFPEEPVQAQAWRQEVHRLSSRFAVPGWFMEWRLRDLYYLRKTSFFVQ